MLRDFLLTPLGSTSSSRMLPSWPTGLSLVMLLLSSGLVAMLGLKVILGGIYLVWLKVTNHDLLWRISKPKSLLAILISVFLVVTHTTTWTGSSSVLRLVAICLTMLLGNTINNLSPLLLILSSNIAIQSRNVARTICRISLMMFTVAVIALVFQTFISLYF